MKTQINRDETLPRSPMLCIAWDVAIHNHPPCPVQEGVRDNTESKGQFQPALRPGITHPCVWREGQSLLLTLEIKYMVAFFFAFSPFPRCFFSLSETP